MTGTAAAATAAPVVDVAMPPMGGSVTEATILDWLVAPGDAVIVDQTLCTISTDKVDADVPAPTSGIVSEIVLGPGTTGRVGDVIARVRVADGHAPLPRRGAADGPDANGLSLVADERAAEPPDTGAAVAPQGGRRPHRASPVARRMALAHGVDLADVIGSGPGGRVRKRDLEAHLASAAAPVREAPPGENDGVSDASAPPARAGASAAGSTETLSRMRQVIGRRMRESLDTAATCWSVVECDMSRVAQARVAAGHTFLPYVAAACVTTLREFPTLNATLNGHELTRYETVHLGIAVSLGDRGLVVPVIHDAQDLSVEGLARRIKDVASRARAGALAPADVAGGTFTITNPGAFGSVLTAPIINQPQVAILDMDAVVKRPVVVAGPEGEDALAIRPMANLCLSWDHRAMDGALASQFLATLRDRLQAWPA